MSVDPSARARCAAFEFGADAMVALLLLLLPQLPATGLPFRNLSGTVPLPSDPHLEWHHAELGALISSGMGGSVGQESSPCVAHSPYPLAPPAPPATAYNGSPDPEQWVAAAKALGAKYVTLVASEMFGFSLWPSAVSNYTVAHSGCKLAPPCDVLSAFVMQRVPETRRPSGCVLLAALQRPYVHVQLPRGATRAL